MRNTLANSRKQFQTLKVGDMVTLMVRASAKREIAEDIRHQGIVIQKDRFCVTVASAGAVQTVSPDADVVFEM